MKVLAAFVLATVAVATQAHPDIDQITASSANAPVVAFERTTELTVPGKPTVVRVEQFNPAAQPGRQWKLLRVDGRTPTSDELSRSAAQPDGKSVAGFHQLHQLLGAAKPDCALNGSQTICHWASLPAGSVEQKGPDFSRKLSADVTLAPEEGRNRLKTVKVYAAQPFSIMAVAKLHRLNVVSEYIPGPSGKPFLAKQTIDVHVSAPFGKGANSHTVMHFRPL